MINYIKATMQLDGLDVPDSQTHTLSGMNPTSSQQDAFQYDRSVEIVYENEVLFINYYIQELTKIDISINANGEKGKEQQYPSTSYNKTSN
jgi:hypothetical protein